MFASKFKNEESINQVTFIKKKKKIKWTINNKKKFRSVSQKCIAFKHPR